MKKILKQTVILGMLILGYNISFGQISQGGIPYSFKSNLKKSDTSTVSIDLNKSIPITVMPKISEQTIDSIKQQNELQYQQQFAYGFNVNIDVKTSSTIDSLDVGLLYRLSIKSDSAKSLNLIFKKYILPKGAKLFIYSKDQQNIIGAFTSNNNKQSERLPTLPVFGDEITVEYFEPYFTDFKGQIIIGEVNHDFIGIVYGDVEDDFGSASDCNIDINCPEGNNWQEQKRSVCRIIKGGNTHCTGALLNNTDVNGIPYFLTANHCISSQSEADDCVFIFNYESSSCNGGDGGTSQTVAGGTILSSRSGSDFILLELTHKPFSTYNPFYAGWDNRNIPSPSGVSITHPRGDVKKIALYNQTLTQEIYLNSNDWRVIWEDGTVEPASSGGPLFNNDRRVIGQVHGGNPNDICTSNDHAFFGRFDVSWDAGNSSSERLRDWLDPLNGNVTVLDGANVCSQGTVEHLNLTHTVNSGVVEIQQATKTITSTSHIKSGATVTYEAGQSITLEPGFVAEAGSDFTAKIKNFNCVPGCHPISIDLLPNVFTPNGDGINDNLCYPVTNATSYEFEAYNRWGNRVFSSSGSVTGNMACVWDGTGSCSYCWYAVIITFKNECHEVSEAYGVTVIGDGNKKSAKSSELSTTDSTNTEDKLLLNILSEQELQNFDFKIFPNPTNGNFTIEVESTDLKLYSFEIISSIGKLVYKIEKLNENKIEINKIGLPSGIYYIRLNDGISVITKKMIVQ